MSVSLTEEEKELLALMSGEVGKNAYPDEYLEEFFLKVGVQEEDQKRLFAEKVRYAGGRYLDLKRMNAGRYPPHKQNKVLDRYRQSLEQVLNIYKEIQETPVVRGKLERAVRERYEKTTEPEMKKMFHPYCTDSGMATTLFENFLYELIQAADESKEQLRGYDKADLSNEFFVNWLTVIGKYWPKSAAVKFALGKYDKEAGIYTSPCIPILQDIVSKIEFGISEKDVETALRRIKKEKLLKQPVANFLIA